MCKFTKRYHVHIMLACLIILSSNAAAQRKVETFAFEYDFFPSSALEEPLPAAPDLETQVSDFTIRVAYPLVLAPQKTFLLNKLSYQYLDFSYENDIDDPPFRPDRLHEISYELSLITRLSPKWSVMLMANPNLATDFENISGKHFKFGGGVVFSRSPSKALSYGLGGRWTNEFGSGLFLPVLILNYFGGSNFHADILLPKRVELFYLPNQDLEIGLAGRVKGNHYRLGESATLPNNVSTEDSRVKYSVITLGPALRIHTLSGTYLTFDGGLSLVRRFEFFDADDNEINTFDLESKLFLRAGLQFRR